MKPWEKYQGKPWESYAAPQIALTQSAQTPDPMLDPTGSFGENFLAGAGKAFVDIGRGAKDMAGDATAMLTGSRPQWAQDNDAAIAESRRLDAPLMQTGGGMTGNIGANIAMMAPTMAIPGANTMAGAGAIGGLLGALQPTMEDESRALNAGIGAGLGMAGQYAGDKLATHLTAKAASRAAAKSSNVTRDAVLLQGVNAGYRFDPAHTNPSEMGLLTKSARQFSGMRSSEAMLSRHNQDVTNSLAKRALGLADDVDLESAIPMVIKDSLDDYANLSSALSKAGTIPIKAESKTKVASLLADYDKIAEAAPEISAKNPTIEGIKDFLSRGEIDGGAAIRVVRRLREKAATGFKAIGDDAAHEAAKIQRATADAIEDAIDRALTDSGDDAALSAFRAARVRLAKAFDVESALDGGQVSAAKLARLKSRGRPLTDELELIAEVGSRFPKVTQAVKNARDPYSTLETGFTATGAVLGEPTLMALGLARPAVRAGLLSRPGQMATVMPSYAPSGAERLGGLLASPGGQMLLRSSGPASIGLLQQ